MRKLLVALAASLTLWGCSNDSSTSSIGAESSIKTGSAQISVKTQQVGRLAKRVADIEMASMTIELSADGELTIASIVSLSGNGSSQAIVQFDNLAPLKTWTAVATSYDQNGVVIHQGGQAFYVYPDETNQVTLDLNAKYSMLKAEYAPIADSVTSIHLSVDDVEVVNQSFAPGSTPSAILGYDYLEADGITSQNIKMQAKGSYWKKEYTLYEGQVDIVVNPGVDTSYVVVLDWVGPGQPPRGAANITVNLGAIGTVTIDGQIGPDPFFGGSDYSVLGFLHGFHFTRWGQTGSPTHSIDKDALEYAHSSGTVTSYIFPVPASGVIAFDYTHNVLNDGGNPGDNILGYKINGTETVLASSTNSGSVALINVSADDSFEFITRTPNGEISGSITNFVFTQNP